MRTDNRFSRIRVEAPAETHSRQDNDQIITVKVIGSLTTGFNRPIFTQIVHAPNVGVALNIVRGKGIHFSIRGEIIK